MLTRESELLRNGSAVPCGSRTTPCTSCVVCEVTAAAVYRPHAQLLRTTQQRAVQGASAVCCCCTMQPPLVLHLWVVLRNTASQMRTEVRGAVWLPRRSCVYGPLPFTHRYFSFIWMKSTLCTILISSWALPVCQSFEPHRFFYWNELYVILKTLLCFPTEQYCLFQKSQLIVNTHYRVNQVCDKL
jgi:hypothetical protein